MAEREPFRLRRVWDVRRLQALARLAEWSRWQARAEEARREASRMEAERRRAAGALATVGASLPAVEMAARWREVEALGRRTEAAHGRARVLAQEAATRQREALNARQEEQAYQRLYQRHRERQRLEALRREQARVDEVAGRVAGGRGPHGGGWR